MCDMLARNVDKNVDVAEFESNPRRIKVKLTSAGLRHLVEKPGRYGDGGGLFFRTLGSGKAYWAYRFRVDGREREMSIGPFPEVSLAQARAKHMELRRQVIVDKLDPLAERLAVKTARALKSGKPTFGELADAHLETNKDQWKNAKHRDQWHMTLTKYCAPIRDAPVDQVDTAGVLKVLTPLWTVAPETASRLRGRIEAVLNRARALGLIDMDRANPARWKGHLDQLLPSPKKVGFRRGHHAAMPYGDLPAFMATLTTAPGVSARALLFGILCAARSGEVFGMTWAEVDLQAGVWAIPAERMKSGRPHRVPLSPPALEALRWQAATRGESPFVFLGRNGRPLSQMALAMTMRRLGAGAFTPHGFTSSFRDWCGDWTSFPREIAEAALAHATGDATEPAYRRSDALEKRRALMDAWASLCFPTSAEIVPFPQTKGRPV
jgi:integrase